MHIQLGASALALALAPAPATQLHVVIFYVFFNLFISDEPGKYGHMKPIGLSFCGLPVISFTKDLSSKSEYLIPVIRSIPQLQSNVPAL